LLTAGDPLHATNCYLNIEELIVIATAQVEQIPPPKIKIGYVAMLQ